MAQPTTNLYTSTIVPLRHGEWRQAQLPVTVDTPKGELTTSGQTFGLQVGPNDPVPSVPAKLKVRTIIPVTVDVDVELAVWSNDRRELAIRPHHTLPWWVPVQRYLDAAIAVVDELGTRLTREALAVDAATHLRPAEVATADDGDAEDLPLSA